MHPYAAEALDVLSWAVRGDDDELRGLRLDRFPHFADSEPHIPGVRGDLERPQEVDHAATSSSGAGAGVTGLGFGGSFGRFAGGLYTRFTAPVPRVTGWPTITLSA